MYCLKDELNAKYNQPYFPEKESDEQSVKTAIRLRTYPITEHIAIGMPTAI
jgi:hypothetical protein